LKTPSSHLLVNPSKVEVIQRRYAIRKLQFLKQNLLQAQAQFAQPIITKPRSISYYRDNNQLYKTTATQPTNKPTSTTVYNPTVVTRSTSSRDQVIKLHSVEPKQTF
jgi:hypothetical protein